MWLFSIIIILTIFAYKFMFFFIYCGELSGWNIIEIHFKDLNFVCGIFSSSFNLKREKQSKWKINTLINTWDLTVEYVLTDGFEFVFCSAHQFYFVCSNNLFESQFAINWNNKLTNDISLFDLYLDMMWVINLFRLENVFRNNTNHFHFSF